MLKSIPLDYQTDSSELVAALIDLPGLVYLDSGALGKTLGEALGQAPGQIDIISACPFQTFHDNMASNPCHPFQTIKTALQQYASSQQAIPFTGGFIGYFSYDLGRTIEKLPTIALKDIPMPELAGGLYDWAIIVDHSEKKSYLVSEHFHPTTASIIEMVLQRLDEIESQPLTPFKLTSDWQANMTKEEYAVSFQKIIDYIYAGDCYQANLTQRFSAKTYGHPWLAYQQLRQANPAAYGAYLQYPFGTVLSCSPERFLTIEDQQVTTQPIKGTRARHSNPERDRALGLELLASEKDRAENLMIVDLLRNDLGKNCETASIKVPKLFQLMSLPAVHHLYSTVTGKLLPDKHPLDLFRGAFPGGSITGTPKIRAMEIIEECEPHRRNIYCGSIGYCGFNQNMDTNIAIRTLVHCEDTIYCAAGGALVADSNMDDEYQESLDKINILMKTLAVR